MVAGDVALAACVRLTGRSLADFGFPEAANAKADPYRVAHYGFSDDPARFVARKKWAAWSTARAFLPGGKR